ncbi:MAG: hypothetical protein KAX72_04510 [Chitinophagales bacterium]|nr:hypothetical protein [Chitinophagales bacterium]
MDQQLPKHDCRNFVKKVFLVLDGELPETERNLFIMDIQRCKGCLEHFHIEKTFKDFIAAKMERKDCSEKLKQTIISQVQSNPET